MFEEDGFCDVMACEVDALEEGIAGEGCGRGSLELEEDCVTEELLS